MLNRTRKNKSPQRKMFDKAWRAFSSYIRKRDKSICFTCGAEGNQSGHFIHGKTKPTYFMEKNVHCQCSRCNLYLNGNGAVYLRNIQKKYGIKKGDELLALKYAKPKIWKLSELEKIYNTYKKLCQKN